jgi:two-component system, sensor histidine kinase and response regulator
MNRIQEIKSLDDDGSDAVLKELVTIYLDTTPPRLKKLIESFYLKDYATVRKEAHALRSSSSAIGAELMGQSAAAVEYAKENEEDFMREHIKNMFTEFETLKIEFSALV